MDPRAREHLLTDSEAAQFQRDGFFIVEEALPNSIVERLRELTADVVQEDRVRLGIKENRYHGVIDFIGQRDEFLQLVDWYRTVPKLC